MNPTVASACPTLARPKPTSTSLWFGEFLWAMASATALSLAASSVLTNSRVTINWFSSCKFWPCNRRVNCLAFTDCWCNYVPTSVSRCSAALLRFTSRWQVAWAASLCASSCNNVPRALATSPAPKCPFAMNCASSDCHAARALVQRSTFFLLLNYIHGVYTPTTVCRRNPRRE